MRHMNGAAAWPPGAPCLAPPHLLLLLPGRQRSVHDAVGQVDLLPELARPPLHLKLCQQHRLQHLVVLHILRTHREGGRGTNSIEG